MEFKRILQGIILFAFYDVGKCNCTLIRLWCIGTFIHVFCLTFNPDLGPFHIQKYAKLGILV